MLSQNQNKDCGGVRSRSFHEKACHTILKLLATKPTDTLYQYQFSLTRMFLGVIFFQTWFAETEDFAACGTEGTGARCGMSGC